MQLGAVSSLSQQALIIDVTAKVLADNLAALLCACAKVEYARNQDGQPVKRQCNRAYAGAMLRMLPSVLMFVGDVLDTIDQTLVLLRHCAPLQPSTKQSLQTSRPVCLQGVAWLKFGALEKNPDVTH